MKQKVRLALVFMLLAANLAACGKGGSEGVSGGSEGDKKGNSVGSSAGSLEAYTEAPQDYVSVLEYNKDKIDEVDQEFQLQYPKEYKVLKEEYGLDVARATEIGLKFKDAADALDLFGSVDSYHSDKLFQVATKDGLLYSLFFTYQDPYMTDEEYAYEYYYIPDVAVNARFEAPFGDFDVAYRSGNSSTLDFGEYKDFKNLKGKTQEGILEDLDLFDVDHKTETVTPLPGWLLHSGMDDGDTFYEDIKDKPVKLTVLDVEEVSIDVFNAKGIGAYQAKVKIESQGFQPYIQDSIILLPKDKREVLEEFNRFGIGVATYSVVYAEGKEEELLDKIYKVRSLCIANTFQIKEGNPEHRSAFNIFDEQSRLSEIPAGY